MSWSHKASITVDHTKCGASDSSNFPVLVSLTDAKLKQTSGGGDVTNVNGYDVNFFSDTNLTSLLSWEMESYDGSAGTILAWVKLPTLSSSADTVFYVAVGNATVTTFQGGAAGAAWSQFKGVYHLSDGVTLSGADSSSQGNTGTLTTPTATAGQIDGGGSFNGSSGGDYILTKSVPVVAGTSAWTISAWAFSNFPGTAGGNGRPLYAETTGSNDIAKLDSCDSTSPHNAIITYRDDAGTLTQLRGSVVIDDNAWHHIAGVLSAGVLSLYVDGNLDNSGARGGTDTMTEANFEVRIGGDKNAAAARFLGVLDEIHVSSVGRSADWIKAEYNNQHTPSTFVTLGTWVVGPSSASTPGGPFRVGRLGEFFFGSGGSGGSNASVAPSTTSFTFTLPESKLTSAAVYTADGTKVRDLWGGVRLPAGTYTRTWDNTDDNHAAAGPSTTYTVKLTHHNIAYGFANLFNCGDIPTGLGAFYGYTNSPSVRVCGSTLIWPMGYNEGGNWHFKSTVASPLTYDFGLLKQGDHWTSADVACDATTVYGVVIRNGFFSAEPQDTFIIKYPASTGTLGTWSGLTPDAFDFSTANGLAGANYSGVALSCGTNASTSVHTYDISKISVQQSGTLLAVAQPNSNRVLFFNKNTGAVARTTLTETNPTCIAFGQGADEGSLYISTGASNNQFTKYTDNGTSFALAAVIFPATNPTIVGGFVVDIATDPSTTNIALAVGESIQQVLGYTTALASAWTLGQAGGYAGTTAVSTDRFRFLKTYYGGSLAFESDGKLWVFDQCLHRYQKWNAAKNSVLSTMHIAGSYHCTYDQANTNNLFANFYCAYTRDWTKTNTPGNFGGSGSWTLTNFYGETYVDSLATPAGGGIQKVCSTSGHTYAIINNSSPPTLVELTGTGVRAIGTTGFYSFDASMNLYLLNATTKRITKQVFSALDASNNPVWVTPAQFTSWTAADDLLTPTTTIGQTPLNFMSDGSVAVCDNALVTDTTKYHVGILAPTATTWRARHGRPIVASIPYPKTGYTSTNGGTNFAQGVWASGEFMVLAASGEFYGGGQSGKFLIYNKDGMYVDQLGHTFTGTSHPSNRWAPALGTNGNPLGVGFFLGNSLYRLIHGMESQGLGVFEYTFNNFASYGIATGSGTPGSAITMSSITGSTGYPSSVGSSTDSDTFHRADGAVGNGWTALGSSNMAISGNVLKANDPLFNAFLSNTIYRGSDVTESCQKIIVPAGLYGTTYTRYNASSAETRTGHALVARLNSATGVRILAQLNYIRNGAGDLTVTEYGNGTFQLDLATVDSAGVATYIGGLNAEYLPVNPGSSYSLAMVVSGTSPTRIYVRVYDETMGVVVMEDYTETYVTAVQSAGKIGIALGHANSAVTSWANYGSFTWAAGGLPPVF